MLKALILNSGIGSRMGVLTLAQPKCMTGLSKQETIVSRCLTQLCEAGVDEVVMTTGYFGGLLTEYISSLLLPIKITFVENPIYEKTNYIYSMYLAREYLDCDVLYLHGDMVLEPEVLKEVLASKESCVAVSTTTELPQKDFKAEIADGRIIKIGVNVFESSLKGGTVAAAQPIYKLLQPDFEKWLERISSFCEKGVTGCYAEDALNEVLSDCNVIPLDVQSLLCGEIDDDRDLKNLLLRGV